MDTIELIKTSDANLATTLLTLGFTIEGTDTTANKTTFYFIQNDQLTQSIDRYWRGELLVDPKSFGAYRREIMTRIHAQNTQELQ